MARIILVVFCGVLVFVVVSRFAPRFLEQYVGVSVTTEEVAAEETAAKEKPAAKKSPAAVKSKSTKAAASSTSQTPAADIVASTPATGIMASPNTAVESEPEVAVSDALPADGLVRINRDNATLYSTNNYVGPVVGLLKKGAIVEPLYTLSSAGQDWTFVTARQEKLAGFVLNENLAVGKAPEQAKR